MPVLYVFPRDLRVENYLGRLLPSTTSFWCSPVFDYYSYTSSTGFTNCYWKDTTALAKKIVLEYLGLDEKCEGIARELGRNEKDFAYVMRTVGSQEGFQLNVEEARRLPEPFNPWVAS